MARVNAIAPREGLAPRKTETSFSPTFLFHFPLTVPAQIQSKETRGGEESSGTCVQLEDLCLPCPEMRGETV